MSHRSNGYAKSRVIISYPPSTYPNYLLNAITDKRPNYAAARAKMKQVCAQYHTPALVDWIYKQAEQVVEETNQRVQAAQDIVNAIPMDGVLTGAPFSHPIDFVHFDFVMNPMVVDSVEWAQWVVFFALGGYVGNFALSLTDHAENGFFFRTEWVPVAASAAAEGFLIVPLILEVSRSFIDLCIVVLILEACVGVRGFLLHANSNLQGPSVHMFDNFIYGAAPLAPLLFTNLMLVGTIGLWQLRAKMADLHPPTMIDTAT